MIQKYKMIFKLCPDPILMNTNTYMSRTACIVISLTSQINWLKKITSYLVYYTASTITVPSHCIKDTLNKRYWLTNEDAVCSPNHIDLYTNMLLTTQLESANPEKKNHDLAPKLVAYALTQSFTGGSHGWNTALEPRPWVWVPGRGSSSPVVTFKLCS